MAGMGKRVSMIFKSKANRILDKAEDPRETLDYSYEQQLQQLQKFRRGVADVATSRKRVELQLNQVSAQADKLQAQAQQALAAGREDLAREALTRKAALTSQVADLTAQHDQLVEQEAKLTAAAAALAQKVEAFRTKKETIKANYTAAEAQTRIAEAYSGLSEDMADVGLAVQRAEDKTAQLQARAGALDELMASGALDEPAALGRGDDIQAELDRISADSGVESELSKLKAQLGQAPAAGEIEAGTEPGGA